MDGYLIKNSAVSAKYTEMCMPYMQYSRRCPEDIYFEKVESEQMTARSKCLYNFLTSNISKM